MRTNSLNFIGNEIGINVQKDFIEHFYLIVWADHVVKMFMPSEHFDAFLMATKSTLS